MNECAHAACKCQAGSIRHEGKDYCSAVCVDAVVLGQSESRCPCPHDGCPGN